MKYSPIDRYEKIGVRSIPCTAILDWEIANDNSYNASRYILKMHCEKHEGEIEEIQEERADECWKDEQTFDGYDDFEHIDMKCLTAAAKKTNSVELDNIALMGSDDRRNFESDYRTSSDFKYVKYTNLFWAVKSFACPDVTVRIEYVFIPISFLNMAVDYEDEFIPEFGPVAIYTRIDVIDGGCAPNYQAVATPALVHTVNIELRDYNLSSLSRQQI